MKNNDNNNVVSFKDKRKQYKKKSLEKARAKALAMSIGRSMYKWFCFWRF